ncbi:MAG: 8-oxo-dGTP diphosphatase [Oscillospiraceae bacterium]|nr:8-oxo-dGTP diphosphatase [Oscillospiraceae bacterium]
MRTENVTLTNMCMIYDGERVLVQDNVDDKNWKGIRFPGGHVEKGEPFTDAVIREVFEETGLTICSPRLCGIKDWTNDDGSRYMVLLYKTDNFSGELRSSDEGQVFWVDLKQLYDMELAQDMAELIKVFCDDDLSEFYYERENGEWNVILK